MLLKNTTLTEGLRDRLEAAGVERTLDVFQRGPDVYVGAPPSRHEIIEVQSIAAAHAVEPFGGTSLKDEPPDGYNVLSPNGLYHDEIAAIEEARGITHDCARYGVTRQGGLRIRPGERGDTMPPEAWRWLTGQWIKAKIGPMAKEA